MYYKRAGTLYKSNEAQNKIDSFNKELKNQYRQHNTDIEIKRRSNITDNEKKDECRTIDISNTEKSIFTGENIIIIGLIILLLFEENKDYLLIGILASIILLNQ